MNKDLHITASVDQPYLLENLVEKLAYRRYKREFSKEEMPKGLKTIETSSVEVYISGNIEFDSSKDEKIRMPFITSLLFTCTQANNRSYLLNWSISLS